MKSSHVALALVCLWTTSWAKADVQLTDHCTLVFASKDQGQHILQTRDDFVKRMSPFDRAARMKTDRDVSERDYLNFVGRSVLAWTPREEQRVTTALEPLKAKFDAYDLPFPNKIYLIKTTGKAEGGAGYTRSNAIIFPKAMLMMGRGGMQRYTCHELFHVLSRANPKLRDRLYRIIGFEKCSEVKLPKELQPRKITNPDAPVNDHCIKIKIGDTEQWVVPVLLSKSEKYNVRRRDELLNYLRLYFLLMRRDDKTQKAEIIYDGEEPRMTTIREMSGFMEQVGRNTGYIIHPEEILADNFALLILREQKIRSHEILDKMRKTLEANHKKSKKN